MRTAVDHKEWIAFRNEILRRPFDEASVRGLLIASGMASAAIADADVIELAYHKARSGIRPSDDFPAEEVRKSVEWLKARGSQSFEDHQ
jgi:hypothetical protein